MKRSSESNLKIFLLAIVLVAIALAPAAAREVATMQAAGGSVQWSPKVEYERLVLTVSGGGVVIRQEFERGATPSFSLVDRQGNSLPDGSYTWELVVIPRAESLDREAYANEWRSEDGTYTEMARFPKGQSQSGHFRILGGAVADNSAAEAPPAGPEAAPAAAGPGAESAGGEIVAGDPIERRGGDFVIVQDLIVDGSACIGFDCVNGESFGFDTLRLKENNLRIKFLDTSVAASFPTQDWELTANESTNGGLNKFSITAIAPESDTPFTIEAGAPSHSLYVDDAGRIGNGTSTPVTDIHVRSGNTPTLRLDQDGSSGFTPQVWDVAGNEANFFVRDATGGSALPFKIIPGADTNSIVIQSDGDVGIGTNSPDQRLHVQDGNLKIGETDEAATRTIRISNDQNQWLFQNSSAGGDFSFRNATAGVTPFEIETTAPANLMTLTATGVQISGIVVHPPDYVFEPDYELESIEEHAEYMWEKKHLPAVGKGQVSEDGQAVFNLTSHSFGILEELEKAHIYIDQLNSELKTRDERLADLEAKIARLESLVTGPPAVD